MPSEVVYLQRCLVVTWLVPRETAAVSTRSAYTMQPCTILRHFMQSHIRRVHACLGVTCNLHFWQNDRYLLRATAVTWGWGLRVGVGGCGWNGYQNGRRGNTILVVPEGNCQVNKMPKLHAVVYDILHSFIFFFTTSFRWMNVPESDAWSVQTPLTALIQI